MATREGHDGFSDSEEGWVMAKSTKRKQPADKIPPKTGPVEQDNSKVFSKVAIKNARRRANRKKSTSLSESPTENKEFDVWKERDSKSTETLYEEQLKEAMLLSLVEAKSHEKEREEEMKEIVHTVSSSRQNKKQKGVTLSLDEFHRSSTTPQATPLSPPPSKSTVKKNNDEVSIFDKIEFEVQAELQKEEIVTDIKNTRTPLTVSNESIHIAQLLDELEKKETIIQQLLLEQETTKAEMKEVKIRNQVLYKMLSRGEFSCKSELLEQIEEFSVNNSELSNEIERLSNELEKERSLNKSLQKDLQKSQTN